MNDRVQFEWGVAVMALIVVLWCFQEVAEIKAEAAASKVSSHSSEPGANLLPIFKKGLFE